MSVYDIDKRLTNAKQARQYLSLKQKQDIIKSIEGLKTTKGDVN